MKLPPVLVYTLLRLLAFLVPLGLMMLLPIFRQNWLVAVVFAALIGLSLSLIFLRRRRDAVSREMERARRSRRLRDEDTEDAEADAADRRPPAQPAKAQNSSPE